MKRDMTRVLSAALLGSLAACAVDSSEPGSTAERIVHGTPTLAYPSVGVLRGGNPCTATLVGDRTVLTAAHCVQFSQDPRTYTFEVGGQSLRVAAVVPHPGYSGAPNLQEQVDLAVLRLTSAAAGVAPSRIVTKPVQVGDTVTLVGYGFSEDPVRMFGTRRAGLNTVAEVHPTVYRLVGSEPATWANGGTGRANFCFGDSGGPSFERLFDEPVVVGVHSYISATPCGQDGFDARVDPHQRWIAAASLGNAQFWEPPALRLRDVTHATRSGHVSRTEYFTVQNDGTWRNHREVYLLGSDGWPYDYPGRTFDGDAVVGHTFDTVAEAPYSVDLSIVDAGGHARQLTVYFPGFATTRGRKMIFYIGADGSTYYADAEHDGVNDESSEMLPRSVAITPRHLARRASSGPPCTGSDCRPDNDERSTARRLALAPGGEVTVMGTTERATNDGPAVPCGCTARSGNVWYYVTLDQRSVVYFDTAGSVMTDTSLYLTDSVGQPVPGQPASGFPDPGLCNDDARCQSTSGGVTSTTLQSSTAGVLDAGTYYVSVGGCGSGPFLLHGQVLPTDAVQRVSTAALTGSGATAPTALVGQSRQAGTCGGNASGEDVHWFVTCGGQPQSFSLCAIDGGSFTRRAGTVDFDPVLYLRSAQTGGEVACNDDGGAVGSAECVGTGGDTLSVGARLQNVIAPRGLNAVFVDERAGGAGMVYSMRHTVRAR